MLLSSMITMIRRHAPDWGVPEVIDIMNDVQLTLCSRRVSQLRVVDPTTGKDPVLTTVAGTYRYPIDVTTSLLPADGNILGMVYKDSKEEPVEIHAEWATQVTPLYVVFSEDPGNNDYYIEYYKKPPQIISTTESSSNIQLIIPEKHHLDFVTGCVARIQSVANGSMDKYYEWEKLVGGMIISTLNEQQKTIIYYRTPRGY